MEPTPKRLHVRAMQRAGYLRNKLHYVDALLRKTYSVTLEHWNALWRMQGGVCAICGGHEVSLYRGVLRSLSIDHDHTCCPGTPTCGQCTRGLLCMRCNRALGLFQENPELLRAAAEYLEQGGAEGIEKFRTLLREGAAA